MRKKVVGVIGAGECDEKVGAVAEEMGERIAISGYMLYCGGLGGVMLRAAKGAFQAGGITIGILPGVDSNSANDYITVPVTTGMGHARNVIIVQSADILVAVSGGYGTLSEIGLAMKMGKPVIGLGSWSIIDGMVCVRSPQEAIETIVDFFKPTH